ncbi:hypothetical protein [Devosia sp.]|uniref:hypothetical protein n=1 Tax=Devosia sp. TaxID=1871048 RepID=UPI0032654A5D
MPKCSLVITNPVARALASIQPLLSGNEDQRQFVLLHGTAFVPADLPHGVRKRKIGTCFERAANLALDDEKLGLDLRYAEGFAFGPGSQFPVRHAWLSLDGRAIDPTWWPHSPRSTYFGVEFPTVTVARAMVERGYYGLLDPIDDLVRSGLKERTAA